MSQLFTPIKLGKLSLSNRIIIAPMCQYSAEQGKATPRHRIHLGHLPVRRRTVDYRSDRGGSRRAYHATGFGAVG